MIKPDKLTSINNSVLYSVAVVVDIMKHRKKMKYGSLYKRFDEKVGDSSMYLFIPALDFLYLVGKMSYNSTEDTLEMNI